MNWILRLLLSGLSLILADWLIDSITISGFGTALIAAIILGLVNLVVRPLVVLLTLPVTIATFGLFLLIINAFAYLLVSYLVPGFDVTSFWGAFWGAIVTSIISGVLNAFVKKR